MQLAKSTHTHTPFSRFIIHPGIYALFSCFMPLFWELTLPFRKTISGQPGFLSITDASAQAGAQQRKRMMNGGKVGGSSGKKLQTASG